MRQQTKPFIIERKPSRKPKPDAPKPMIWGSLDADIAQGLQDQRDMDHATATGGADRAWVPRCSKHFLSRLQRMQKCDGSLRMGRILEDGPLVIGKADSQDGR